MHQLFFLLLVYSITCSEPDLQKKEGSNEKEEDIRLPYCNAEWCDPSHEPYPNIVSIMTGYNIFRGNPFTSQTSDPGFSTGYIFVPTVKTNDGTYALHSGITVRQNLQCSLKSSSETIKTVDGYLKKIKTITSIGKTFVSNQEWQVSAEAELGEKGTSAKVGVSTTIPPLIASAFLSSKEYNDNKRFFTEKRGVVTLRDATCATYTVRISPYDPPPFSDGFKNSLSLLNTASTSDQLKYFEDFIQEFGTHFLQQTTMGARTAIIRRYSQEEFRKSTDEAIHECIEDRLNVTIAGFGIGSTSDSCKKIDLTVNTDTINGFDRESVTSYGSKPTANIIEWSQQDFDSPLPIKMQLRPITDLFSEKYLKEKSKIDFVKILEWFEPLYKNFCEEFKKSLGIDECNPARINQCGWSDNCIPRQQVCENTENGKFTCCNLKCLDSVCKNGGICQDVTDENKCNFKCICEDGWEGTTCEVKVAKFEDMRRTIESKLTATASDVKNNVFALSLYNHLIKTYTAYDFAVLAYKQYDEFETSTHAALGNYVHFYKKNGRNVVVGWSKKDSLSNVEQRLMRKIKNDLAEYVTNYRVDALMSVEKAWNDFKKFYPDYPVVFMQVVRYGSGLRPKFSQNTIFIKFSVKDWRFNHESNLVVLLGKMD